MADVNRHTEGWQTLDWKKFQRNVFRLQKRIYQASQRGDYKRMRNLQRLLLRSWSARCLAVRQVAQDNRGKRTAGVDGIASLKPEQRLIFSENLRVLPKKASFLRRVYIPKANGEKRPLGIPIIGDRAVQALVKLVLEPQWEARFEPNSYGFRPGRSAHDAIEAIYNFIRLKPKYVLDADIEKCFDRIDHQQLLAKVDTIPQVRRLIREWLKAGIIDRGETLYPQSGTPQGGVISPLLANIALHGLESHLTSLLPAIRKPGIIRYADDFVILCQQLDELEHLKQQAEKWLLKMGLRLKPTKTRITHTLHQHKGTTGFNFLGFQVQQYPVSKYRTRTFRGKPGFKTLIKPSKESQIRHLRQFKQVIRRHRGSNQAALIADLNPIIRGWCSYFSTVVSKSIFSRTEKEMIRMVLRWEKWRHPKKSRKWREMRYWVRENGRKVFSDGKNTLILHRDRVIQRHTKVIGEKSPFDGDWIYWSTRLSKDPTKPLKVTNLLKIQKGKCKCCNLRFKDCDIMEVHHKDRNRYNNAYSNLELLHGHCHDQIHGT